MLKKSRTGGHSDGRRRRSEASRERIVHAMLALIGEGDVAPSAEDVAARAQVGLRSVFRHFENMDSLYRQIDAAVSAEVLPLAREPFAGADWKAQLISLIARRARIFERIMPYKIAGDLQRHRSAFIAAEAARFDRDLRSSLGHLLPAAKRRDRRLFEALDLILSFESWRRLRKDQKLSVAGSRRVLEHLAELLVTAK